MTSNYRDLAELYSAEVISRMLGVPKSQVEREICLENVRFNAINCPVEAIEGRRKLPHTGDSPESRWMYHPFILALSQAAHSAYESHPEVVRVIPEFKTTVQELNYSPYRLLSGWLFISDDADKGNPAFEEIFRTELQRKGCIQIAKEVITNDTGYKSRLGYGSASFVYERAAAFALNLRDNVVETIAQFFKLYTMSSKAEDGKVFVVTAKLYEDIRILLNPQKTYWSPIGSERKVRVAIRFGYGTQLSEHFLYRVSNLDARYFKVKYYFRAMETSKAAIRRYLACEKHFDGAKAAFKLTGNYDLLSTFPEDDWDFSISTVSTDYYTPTKGHGPISVTLPFRQDKDSFRINRNMKSQPDIIRFIDIVDRVNECLLDASKQKNNEKVVPPTPVASARKNNTPVSPEVRRPRVKTTQKNNGRREWNPNFQRAETLSKRYK